MAQQTTSWRPTIGRRAVVAGVCLAAWGVAIEARLVHLQVVRHADLAARAERQQSRTVAAPAKRGEIRDRHGRLLAFSVDVDSIYAVPAEIDDPRAAASSLCRVLEDCDKEMLRGLIDRLRIQIPRRPKSFVYVQRFVTPETAARVAALDLEGIGFMKESRRYYPNRELGAQVLGYVGVDNVGLGGIEAAYDQTVRGHAGTVLVQTDARRRAFSSVKRPPTTGATLDLTIDESLQHIVERELKAGVTEHKAEAGTVVVMDPMTGEILAMASYPTFNPNTFRDAAEGARKNRAVTDLYEPGSTFKIVTASAALEEGVIEPSAPIDVSQCYITFGPRRIDDDHCYKVLSFAEVIVHSSNVGAIKIGQKLGPTRLGAYVTSFGFGRPSSLDFPGESSGIVWNPAKLNDSALASVSMGYQVGVTPLQMAAAASVVANGGQLLQPRVLKAVVDEHGRTPVTPAEPTRVISTRTAAELTSIMEDVVASGTGRSAKVEGFTVAGKTGTAQKLVAGQYSKSDYNASFVGFVPSRKPALTIVVVVDTPRAGGYHGAQAAAPIFKRIAEASLRQLGVAPTVFPPPPVLVDRRAQALAAEAAQAPRLVSVSASADRVMPDVRGLGAREALRTLAAHGVTPRLLGSGIVTVQTPEPGESLDSATASTLVLGRRADRVAGNPPGTPP